MIDMSKIHNFVYREFGINLNAYKEIQMNRRIETFLLKTNCTTSEEFIKLCSKDFILKEQFLDQITINVTEFFRNIDIFLQLKDIFRKYLPKKNEYKIWCSACSNGSEPYSVGMFLDNLNINYEILATDIDEKMLNYARNAEYKEDEIRGVPAYYLSSYFTINEGKYLVNDDVRNRIEFKKHDLILDEFYDKFDLILCRNVVIYFKKDEQIKIYSKFFNSLNTKGVIFIGATENIYDYNQIGFTKLGTFFYQKEVKE